MGLWEGEPTLNVFVENEPFEIHAVQPLFDALLLVCHRSRYRGPNDFDRNGRVYSREGKVLDSILLGDGIESVQTTNHGVIWTSFFDEGVFGITGGVNQSGHPVSWRGTGLETSSTSFNRLWAQAILTTAMP